MARAFTEWLLRNRRVLFTRREILPGETCYEIQVIRRESDEVVSKLISPLEIRQSRVPLIELAQMLFENPLDRIAVGLALRKRWHEDQVARSMVAGQALSHDRAYTRMHVNCRCVAAVPTPTGILPDAEIIRRGEAALARSARAARDAADAAALAGRSMTSLSESMRRHRTRRQRIAVAEETIADQLGPTGKVPEGTKFKVMAPRNPALPIYRPR